MSETLSIQVGGINGQLIMPWSIPANCHLVEIRVRAGLYVDAIYFVYADADGTHTNSLGMGGIGGEEYRFELRAGEYLTALTGSASQYLDSVRFHTNLRESALFGGNGGDEFTLLAPQNEQVVGLFGRADWYVDAVGIVTRPFASEKAPAKKRANKKAVAQADDLTVIEGIGPKIAQLLRDNGISTFAELANAPLENLQGIIGNTTARVQLASCPTWAQQAALAAQADWDGLKNLQAELTAGRAN